MTNTRRLALRACGITGGVLLALLFGAGAARAGQMQWEDAESLSRSDRSEILALARRAGLGEPETVTFVEGWVVNRVTAKTRVTVDGARRRWNSVLIEPRPANARCGRANALCENRWWVQVPLQRSETWRVTDGEWFRDVELGPGVTLADVEPLMRATHRGELIDVRHIAPDDPNWPPGIRRDPRSNADEVFLIERAPEGLDVSVGLGHGHDIVRVREREGRFEIVSWSETVYELRPRRDNSRGAPRPETSCDTRACATR